MWDKLLMAQLLQGHKCTLVLDLAEWNSSAVSRSYLKYRQVQHLPERLRLHLPDPVPMLIEPRPCSNLRTAGCKEPRVASPQQWEFFCSSVVCLLWTWNSLLALWFVPPPLSRVLPSSPIAIPESIQEPQYGDTFENCWLSPQPGRIQLAMIKMMIITIKDRATRLSLAWPWIQRIDNKHAWLCLLIIWCYS